MPSVLDPLFLEIVPENSFELRIWVAVDQIEGLGRLG